VFSKLHQRRQVVENCVQGGDNFDAAEKGQKVWCERPVPTFENDHQDETETRRDLAACSANQAAEPVCNQCGDKSGVTG
jgi:hypothetical protein